MEKRVSPVSPTADASARLRPAEPSSAGAGGRRGTRLVIGLMLLGLAAAATGIWFQWQQTRRCLAFYGGPASRRISAAATVELWTLAPGSTSGRLRLVGRKDVSRARGLVHLRRGLVEDANFSWTDGSDPTGAPASRLPDAGWSCALAFSDAAEPDRAPTVVAFAFGDAVPATAVAGGRGALTVVGRPGRVSLGRIEAGIQRWMAATLQEEDGR